MSEDIFCELNIVALAATSATNYDVGTMSFARDEFRRIVKGRWKHDVILYDA